MTHPIGTLEWFRSRKRALLLDIRALDDLHASLRYTAKLLESWEAAGELSDMRGAMFTAVVIGYARPFLGSVNSYGEKTQYSVKFLRRIAAFDRKLHDELLALRNKLIAHADGDVFPAQLYTLAATVTSDTGESVKAPPSIGTLCSSSLHSVSDKSAIERIARHIRVASHAVTEKINDQLHEYLLEAGKHAKEFDESKEQPAGTAAASPQALEQIESEVGRIMKLGNLPAMEARMFSPPDASVGHPYLVYRMMALSVKLPWVDIDIGGSSVRFHISEDPEELQARVAEPPT